MFLALEDRRVVWFDPKKLLVDGEVVLQETDFTAIPNIPDGYDYLGFFNSRVYDCAFMVRQSLGENKLIHEDYDMPHSVLKVSHTKQVDFAKKIVKIAWYSWHGILFLDEEGTVSFFRREADPTEIEQI